MKKWLKAFLFLTLLFSLSFNVMAGGAEDMPEPDATETELVEAGFPIVTGIYDAAEDGPIVTPVATDQMGGYVSIYVRGKNINKDTVKPVFYDENGNVISGDVAAVEVSNDRWYGGAFFRIQKKSSPAWEIENTAASNTKNYTVKLESVCGKAILDGNNNYAVYGDKAQNVTIYRRDVFYTSFNEYEESLTLYFSSDVELGEIKSLELGWFDYDSETKEYVMNVVKTVEDAEITVRWNKLTGHYEQKAKFSLKGFDYNNAFDNWTPDFRVTFKNNVTNKTEVYDTSYPSDNINQILGRVSFFQSANKKGTVAGGYDVVLYYPYWIGGVYQFEDTGSDYQYYLTEDEVDYLKDERFSYARYAKGTGRLDAGSFNDDRRYQFCYFELIEKPQKPSGIPVVKASVDEDEMVTLTWGNLSGATGYRVYAVTPDGEKFCIDETTQTTSTFNKMILMEISEMGYEGAEIKVCAYAEKNGMVVEGDLSKAVSLENTISAPSKVLLSSTSYTFNGKAKKPTVTVRDENGDKIASSNYKVTYSNNIKAGTAKVTVTFTGDYASFDKMTRTFKIAKAKASTVKLVYSSYTYSGKKITPKFKTSAGVTLSSTNYTITSIKNNKYPGKATVKVKFKGNYTTGTRTFTFTIKPKSTSVSSVTAAKKAFTVKWKAQKTQTTGYQIQYSTSSSFKNASSKLVSKSYVSKKITGLKSKKTYYVRVRTYKTVSGTKYYSAWSAVKKVKTK